MTSGAFRSLHVIQIVYRNELDVGSNAGTDIWRECIAKCMGHIMAASLCSLCLKIGELDPTLEPPMVHLRNEYAMGECYKWQVQYMKRFSSAFLIAYQSR